MSISFWCSCGFRYEGNDVDGVDHDPLDGGCCNCGGQLCMGCVFREYNHDCTPDCPSCCA